MTEKTCLGGANVQSSDTILVEQKSIFSEEAAKVKTGLGTARLELEKYLVDVQNHSIRWTSVDQLRDELSRWMQARSDDVKHWDLRPAKLHVEASRLEILQLEVRQCSMFFFFFTDF